MMYTDADIEQAQWEQAGRMADAGICLHCEEPLDPHHPKWAQSFADALERFRRDHGGDSYERNGRTYTPWTADSVVRCYGPADPDGSGFHTVCNPWNRENS